MKKKLMIPEDLLRYAKKTFMRRLIPFVVLEAAFALILIFFGDSVFGIIESRAAVTVCYIISLLVPFLITGFPFKLIDRTVYGVVESIDVVRAMSAIKDSADWMEECDNLVIHIENYDGKKLSRTVKKSGTQGYSTDRGLHTDKHLGDRYEIGDKVFHLYGTKQYVRVGLKGQDSIECAVCGTSNDPATDTCRRCGHSLIKEGTIKYGL